MAIVTLMESTGLRYGYVGVSRLASHGRAQGLLVSSSRVAARLHKCSCSMHQQFQGYPYSGISRYPKWLIPGFVIESTSNVAYFHYWSKQAHKWKTCQFSPFSVVNTSSSSKDTFPFGINSQHFGVRHISTGVGLYRPVEERRIIDEKSKVEEYVHHQQRKKERAIVQVRKVQDQLQDAFIFKVQRSGGVSSSPTESAVAPPPKPILTRIMDEVKHYYNGFRLLYLDIIIAAGLLWQVLNGKTLTRRERRQFLRTVADMFRLLPFMVFIIVPFMEFLLPVAIKLFPNMLPSTFEDQSQKEKAKTQQLKLKIQMAEFLQDTLEEIAVKPTTKKSQNKLKEFAKFMHTIRSEGDQPDNNDILRFSSLFEDEITLENLPHGQLKAICRMLMMPAIGTSNYLRFTIILKLQQLKADDKLIRQEGIDALTVAELQVACQARGMRAVGVSTERLKSQLKQWLELSLDEQVPPSLLLLSRAMYVPEHLKTDSLKVTLSQLPERIIDECEVRIGATEGEEVDRQTIIDILKYENQKIREERQRELKKIEVEKELEKKRELEGREVTQDIPSDQELDARLLKILRGSLRSDQEILSRIKNDREEYKEDLIQLAQETIGDVQEAKGGSRLGARIDKMLTSIEAEIEKDLEKAQKGKIDADNDGVITTDELYNALHREKTGTDKAWKICELLDADKDGILDVEELRKAIDLISNEDLDVSDHQVAEVLSLIKKNEDVKVIEQMVAKSKNNMVVSIIGQAYKKWRD